MNEFELFEQIINEIELSMPAVRKNGRIKATKKQKAKHERNMKKAKIFIKLFVRRNRKNFDFSKTNIKDIKAACILDEFSYNCFKHEMNLLPLSKNNYIKQLREFEPQILLVESAWNSYEGGWAVAKQLDDILGLLYYCKKKGIITIFWNKEDPVHYDSFIKKAAHFDYIFTTDENMVEKYKEKTKKDNVFSLMFAAQPQIHNPIKVYENKEEKAVFAGTFYRNKYPERLRCLMRMLYISQKYGLDIYDRNEGKNNPLYVFPKIFQKDIQGRLLYADIAKAYKGYKVNLNINSVVNSPTMFSRRVFEVLASNTPVISNYSPAIENNFKDIVFMGETYDEFISIYEKLFKDEEFYKKICLLGVREVLTKHTYKKRVQRMLECMNLDYLKEDKKILVLGLCDNEQNEEVLINYYEKQTLPNVKFVFMGNQIKNKKYETIEKERVVDFIKQNKIDYISIFNPNNFYGKNYLLDLFTALEYIDDAKFIGKKAYYNLKDSDLILENEGKEYTFSDGISWDSGLISAKMFIENSKTGKLLFKKTKTGENSFAIDRFNFVKNGTNNLSNEIIEKIEI